MPAMMGQVTVERLLECPKTMTNGPCGGVAMDGTCEVDTSHVCVWWEALAHADNSAARMPMPPADWSVGGRWLEAFVTDGPLQAASNTLNKDQRDEVKKRFRDSEVELMGLGSAFDFHTPDQAKLRADIAATKEYIILAHDAYAGSIDRSAAKATLRIHLPALNRRGIDVTTVGQLLKAGLPVRATPRIWFWPDGFSCSR